jgi:lipopolysaccharide/colanic/teichoic acid biosynthesis glycosyltransferase
MYRRIGKRVMDFCLALVLLVDILPLMTVVAIGVAMRLGRPVFFRQMRPGRLGQPFGMWKFRSMGPELNAEGRVLEDEERIDGFGRWLRATSLDELPGLLNVIRGEMSLVGPRPLLWKYLPLYTERQMRRHEVRPGITGLAQVNGRNALRWEEKFELDVAYVERLSFWLDLRILVSTLAVVLGGRGVTSPGRASAVEFFGTCGGMQGAVENKEEKS